jgi:hypothetical protein
MFNTDSDRRDTTIGRFFRWGEFTPTGFFLGLDDGDTVEQKTLEAHILVKPTAAWQSIAFKIRKAFIMRLAFIGGTQEAHVTGFIDHEQVFDRVALLLTTGVVLLFLGVNRAMDRPLSAIMPKRGGAGTSFVCVVPRSVANSAAVRAGSKSWCAKARFNTVWRR